MSCGIFSYYPCNLNYIQVYHIFGLGMPNDTSPTFPFHMNLKFILAKFLTSTKIKYVTFKFSVVLGIHVYNLNQHLVHCCKIFQFLIHYSLVSMQFMLWFILCNYDTCYMSQIDHSLNFVTH